MHLEAPIHSLQKDKHFSFHSSRILQDKSRPVVFYLYYFSVPTQLSPERRDSLRMRLVSARRRRSNTIGWLVSGQDAAPVWRAAREFPRRTTVAVQQEGSDIMTQKYSLWKKNNRCCIFLTARDWMEK